MKLVGNIFLAGLMAVTGTSPVLMPVAFGEIAELRETEGMPAVRLATFDSSTGETTFALSLVPTVGTPETRSSDVLILVDTSASQAGLYQKDSIAVTRELLKRLSGDDRVQIAAVDLEINRLGNRKFESPDAPGLAAATVELGERIPLGSTDLVEMLKSIPELFPNTSADRNLNVVYIGDGVSRAGLLTDRNFSSILQNLTSRNISLSFYAIGPERDIESMAALANSTGGNVFIDSDDPNAINRGADFLASTVRGPVFWPSSSELPENVLEMFPSSVPPIRFDRDVVVIGTLKSREAVELNVSGTLAGQTMSMSWQVDAEDSSLDFAFLPGLLDIARKTGGSNLPILGSGGLMETARVMEAGSRTLAELGTQAMVMGNASAAKTLAEAALRQDENNTTAEIILNQEEDLVRNSDPTVVPGQERPMIVNSEPGSLQLIGPSNSQDEVDRLIRDSKAPAGELQNIEEEAVQRRTNRLRVEVQVELGRATQELPDDPAAAVDRLKTLLEIVDLTTDVEPSTRVELRNRVQSSLAMARQRKLDFDADLAIRQRNIANTEQQRAALQQMETREEEITRHLNRFNALMQEGNYAVAEEKTYLATEIAPNSPETNAAYATAQIAHNYRQLMELKRIREMNFVSAMYEVEFSNIPRPTNPPLVFPDREFWNEIKAKRAKYDSVRLSGNEIDEAILRRLDQPVDDFSYPGGEFSDVLLDLKTRYGINAVLDSSVDDAAILRPDTEVDFEIGGVRLKTALRLLLAKYESTFIVRDEVLLIISNDVKDDPEYFVKNIYNVGDLVAPRRGMMGGGMMGGMGMGGMGMGGMGGGMGGMGMGGMGGGMGGMGGMGMGGGFCIQDEAPATFSLPPAVTTASTTVDTTADSWEKRFSEAILDESLVRDIVREFVSSNRPADAIAVINAALRNNQSQPWMYEALALAMQINGASIADVERAVMSAVDFSTDATDILIAADYLASNKMEKRAIQLLQNLTAGEDPNPEAWLIGMRAASRTSDIEALKWVTKGVLSSAWPDKPQVFDQALLLASEVQQKLKEAGKAAELAEYRRELDYALQRDVVVELAWTGNADLDLFVSEPGGSICSRKIPFSAGGGILMGDSFARENAENGEIREYYVVPRGFSGEYRVMVRKVTGNVTGDRARLTVYGHFNSDKQASDSQLITVKNDESALVLFELEDGRRTGTAAEQRLQRIEKEQFAANRAILAQQFAQNSVSGASFGSTGSTAEDYQVSSRRGNGDENTGFDFPGGFRLPGMVGYQPNITQLPEGTFLTVNHATTADRLYVLISPSPNFSLVTSVTTFNIAGTAQNAQGIGGGGGGGLGGIGGGGGGIGGGGIGGGGGGIGGGF